MLEDADSQYELDELNVLLTPQINRTFLIKNMVHLQGQSKQTIDTKISVKISNLKTKMQFTDFLAMNLFVYKYY